MYPSTPSSPSSPSSYASYGSYGSHVSRASYGSHVSRASYGSLDHEAPDLDDDFRPKRIRTEAPDAESSPASSHAGLVSPISLTSVPQSLDAGSAFDDLPLVPAFMADDAQAPAPAPATITHGSDDHRHEEAVDVYVQGERVVTRACFVARDADLSPHMNRILTCEPSDGFSGLYAEGVGSDLVLAVLPPEGMQGLVYLRHTAARGEALLEAATQMTEAYAEETQVEGRFIVAYATGSLWEDLDDYRQARQAAGETLDQLVDGLIEEHGLDLPLSQLPQPVPGSAPPMPASERLRQAGEQIALRHAAHATALAGAFGGEAVALTCSAVFASWDGNLLDFVQEPDAAFVDAPAADDSEPSDESPEMPPTPASEPSESEGDDLPPYQQG